MRNMTTDQIEYEIKRMSDVMNWPQMHLPVIRRDDLSNRVGVILHTASYPYDVFECNQFVMHDLVIKPLKEGREVECLVHHYNSFREVVEDGWIGD